MGEPASPPCPGAEELRLFVLGQLPGEPAARLEEHVRSCAACRETVRTAATLPETRFPIPSTCAPPGSAEAGPLGSPYAFLTPPTQEGELGRLAGYRILGVLGAGGMGIVFLAEDPHLDRRVALKVMSPALALSEDGRQRFLREARAAAAVEHDHIVPIYQAGQDGDVLFLAMPLLRGESLEAQLARPGHLPVAEVLRLGRELTLGLAAAHARGLVHRDIKPANVWVEAGTGRVKILDFGLARAISEARPGQAAGLLSGTGMRAVAIEPQAAEVALPLTQAGTIVGTPAFMAPEQAQGRPVDGRCDLFSLGCILYRLLAGELPFQGADTAATLLAVVGHHPPALAERRPDVPAALSRLVMDLLAKDPAQRPTGAQEVIRRLDAVRQTEPGKRKGRPWLRKRYLVPALVLAVAVLGIVQLRRGFASPGELTQAHQSLAADCAACHGEPRPVLGYAPPREDQRCQKCHMDSAMTATHHASQKVSLTPNCGTCHSDHRGRSSSLHHVADRDCLVCHKDLGQAMEGKSGYANTVGTFVDEHPDFRDLHKGDPGKLKFNHKYHMTPGIALAKGGKEFTLEKIAADSRPRYREAQADKKDTAPVALQCGSCHQPAHPDQPSREDQPDPAEDRAGWEKWGREYYRQRLSRRRPGTGFLLPPQKPGAYMAPINYETHCAACHPLDYDNPRIYKPIPHGKQPNEVKAFLTAVYSEKYRRNPQELAARPVAFFPLPGKSFGSANGPTPGPELIQQKVDIWMRSLLEGKRTCGECHVAADGGDLTVTTRVIARPQVPAVWLEHARFDHNAHTVRGISCKECHTGAYDTGDRDRLAAYSLPRKGAETVMIEGIQNCRRCHSPAPAARFTRAGLQAGTDCATCHSYHHGKAGLGGQREAGLNATPVRQLEALLRLRGGEVTHATPAP